jgi:hypothetical protein
MTDSKCIYCGKVYEERLEEHEEVCPEHRKAEAQKEAARQLQNLASYDSLGGLSREVSDLAGVLLELKNKI